MAQKLSDVTDNTVDAATGKGEVPGFGKVSITKVPMYIAAGVILMGSAFGASRVFNFGKSQVNELSGASIDGELGGIAGGL